MAWVQLGRLAVTDVLKTRSVTLRSWRMDDAEAALRIFGDDDVARWLSPALERIPDMSATWLLLQQWNLDPCACAGGGRAVGSRTIHGRAGRRECRCGISQRVGRTWRSVCSWRRMVWMRCAVVRPTNTRAAAMARHIGMEWVGKRDKYYDRRLTCIACGPRIWISRCVANPRDGRRSDGRRRLCSPGYP